MTVICNTTTIYNASQTCTLLKADVAKLEAFHTAKQRWILGIPWYEFITNEEVATLTAAVHK